MRVPTNGTSPHAALARLQGRRDIAAAELEARRIILATPDDRLWAEKFGTPHYLGAIRAPQAWDVTAGSTAQRLAVVDTGIDANSPAFGGQLIPGRDVLEGDSTPQDPNGHGTQVAAAAAARGNDGRSGVGVAWRASIMPIRAVDRYGVGRDGDLARGVTWAADHGADVVLLAFGSPVRGNALAAAIRYARERDVLVVAAAGGSEIDEPMYPAAFPGVLAVTRTDWSGDVARSSSGDWVDVAAPGFGIVTSDAAPGTLDAVTRRDGTSFSAALTAGAAVLVRSAYPDLTATWAAARIRNTAMDVGPPGDDDFYGGGLLDVAAAVGAAPGRAGRAAVGDAAEPDAITAARPLVLDTTSTATIAPEGDVDWFRLHIPADTRVVLNVSPPEYWLGLPPPQEMDAAMRVYDSALRLIGVADAWGVGDSYWNNETAFYELLELHPGPARDVYVEAYNANASVSDGTYSVTASTLPGTQFPSTRFFDVHSYSNSGFEQTVAIADVTGDGRKDALVTSSASQYAQPFDNDVLHVRAQRADGWLEEDSTRIPLSPGYWYGLDTGDLDGDKDVDVVVGTSGGVDLLYQQRGALQVPIPLRLAAEAALVRMADLDRDGRKDLVVSGGSTLRVIRQTRTGWAQPVTIAAQAGRDLKVGNLVGDANDDIVSMSWDGAIEVRRGRGDGTFAAPLTFSGDHNGVTIGDVTGDGRRDLVATAGGNLDGAVIVHRRTAGGFAAPVAYPVRDIPRPVAIADFNRDGRADVAVGHSGWDAVSVLLQQPDGRLGTPEVSSTDNTQYQPGGLAAGDLTGDGVPDVAVADERLGLGVLRQRTNRWPREPLWVTSTNPAPNAIGVSSSVRPVVRLGRALDPASASSSNVRLVAGRTGAAIAASVTYDSGAGTLALTPNAPLPDGPYRVVVRGLRGAPSGRMLDTFTTRFRVGAPVDSTPPETTITAGPAGTTGESDATFDFLGTEPGSRYECAPDGTTFQPCVAPREFYSWGEETFAVRAIDPAGNVDPTPATRTFTANSDLGWEHDNGCFNCAQELPGNSGSVQGANFGEYGSWPAKSLTFAHGDVWYQWRPPVDGTATVSTSPAGFDSVVGVYRITSANRVQRIAEDDDDGDGAAARVRIPVVAGRTYYISVSGFYDGWNWAQNNFTLTYGVVAN